jgi:hypothetical protein
MAPFAILYICAWYKYKTDVAKVGNEKMKRRTPVPAVQCSAVKSLFQTVRQVAMSSNTCIITEVAKQIPSYYQAQCKLCKHSCNRVKPIPRHKKSRAHTRAKREQSRAMSRMKWKGYCKPALLVLTVWGIGFRMPLLSPAPRAVPVDQPIFIINA